jgi:hypothetical protein
MNDAPQYVYELQNKCPYVFIDRAKLTLKKALQRDCCMRYLGTVGIFRPALTVKVF